MSKSKKYIVAIINNNCWNSDGSAIIKQDCGHIHRTISGAIRCLNKLSRYWSDGTHNEWAHFGDVYDITSGSPIKTEEIEDAVYEYELKEMRV